MTPRISAQLAERVASAERTMRILWVALMGSVSVYGLVLYQLSLSGMATQPMALPPLVPPALALMLAATGFILFRTLSAPDRIRALLKDARPPQGEPATHAEGLSEAERRLSRVPPTYFTLYILRWAIFESIAVLGLVLGILSGSFEVFVPYGLAAIALMAMSPPRIKQRLIDAIPLLPSDVRAGF